MTQVPPPGSPEQSTVPVCYRHPGRESYVRCTRCERPICPECMNEASVGHQCPECVAEGRRSQRPVRTLFGATAIGARSYVTITIIAINVLAAIASIASAGGRGLAGGGSGPIGFLFGGTTPLLSQGGAVGGSPYQGSNGLLLGPGGISDGEYYRLLTSMFLHFGVLHLVMNMWALWVVGRILEAVLGPVRFLALYLVAGLGGSLAVYLFDPLGLTAGASGAVFGLFAALFIVLRRMKRDTSSIIPLLVINIIISFVPGISLAGHLGGLITGAIVAFAFAYAPQKNRNLYAGAAVVVLLALIAVAVVIQTSAIRGFIPISG
jgi:membrane associated rhomboid family serine protease